MTITVEIPVEFTEDEYELVSVEVEASYGNHGIGTYDYGGYVQNDVQIGWLVEGFYWDETKYTKEQNEIIYEACLREESKFYDILNEE